MSISTDKPQGPLGLASGEELRTVVFNLPNQLTWLRLALTGGQSFALVLLLLALLIGASGVAVSGWVAAHEWSCRVGLTTRYCPAASPEAPRPPLRSDIPA